MVCSECSLNFVAGQVFLGACSVGFFSDLYYQGTNVAGYIVFALVYLSLYFYCGILIINTLKVKPNSHCFTMYLYKL